MGSARRTGGRRGLLLAGMLFIAGCLPVAVLGVTQRMQADRAAANETRLAALLADAAQAHRVRLDTSGAALPARDSDPEAIRSLLNIRHPLRHGGYVWDARGVPAGPVHIRVDLARQIISVFRAGHEIGTAVILYGGDGKPTPVGRFPVLEKNADYHSRRYDAPMPFMLRLTADGVAIHGSHVRRGWATHGCIGVPLAFARLLFAQVGTGDMVTILPPPASGSIS